ncbi:hypothetical protein B0H11DRAFT_2215786 [Mycena galericulata]|nr:hypothetical protein B0H11DRAFT_2215786 [Mycena galericulata]
MTPASSANAPSTPAPDARNAAASDAPTGDLISDWSLASAIHVIRTMQTDSNYIARMLKEYHEREFVAPDRCSWCRMPRSEEEPLFRCHQRGCLEGLPGCGPCIGIAHQTMPMHLIEEWFDNHDRWQRTSLRRAGFVQQLGHDGMPCPNPAQSVVVKEVLHLDGVHELWTRECHCARS